MKQSLGSRLALLLAVCSVIGLAWPTLPHAAPVHDVNDDSAFDATQVGDSAPAPVIKKSTSKAHATKSHNFKTVHRSKKHSAKKYSTKKTKPSKLPHKQSFLKAPKASVTGIARPILGTPDPNVDEPSEMITAIKNNAQDKFWDGKRPYPEQLRERGLAPPPSAPVLTGAIAQKELQKRGTMDGVRSEEPARSNTLRRVSFSEIAGVTFDDQPLRLSASEPFRRSLDTVSFELGRPCKNQEYLGWPMQQSEQTRVDRIFEATNERLKLRGYNLQPQKARSVGSDVSAFTADNGDKKLTGIWSAGDVGLLLLMCDTETPQEAAYAAKMKHPVAVVHPKKSKTKAVKVKKKTKKAPAAKPHTLFKAHTAAPQQPAAQVPTSNLAGGNSDIGAATQPDVPSKPSQPDPNSAPLGTKAPQANTPAPIPTQAPQQPAPSAAAPLVPAPAEEAKPQVIPGAPPKDLPPEPTQSKPQSSATPSINPSTAFIPADVQPSAKDAAKTVKDVVKDAAPSMKALPPDLAAPPITPPSVTDVKP